MYGKNRSVIISHTDYRKKKYQTRYGQQCTTNYNEKCTNKDKKVYKTGCKCSNTQEQNCNSVQETQWETVTGKKCQVS